MLPVLHIAAKDLRQRFRDRSAIVIGFIAPIGIAVLMSSAFSASAHFHVTMTVVDHDHGPVAAAFISAARSPELHGLMTVRTAPTDQAAREDVKAGRADAAVSIPAGFSTSLMGAGGTLAPLDVTTNADRVLAGQVVESVVKSFSGQLDADRLAIATAAAGSHLTPAQTAGLIGEATKARIPISVIQKPAGKQKLEGLSYYGPGMAIFFVLFAVSFSARSFFHERDESTLDRIAAAPISPLSVLAGKAVSAFVYGIVSLTTMAVVTTIALGAYWGPPLAVAAVSLAMVLSVVAFTALVIVSSKTLRQAEGLASITVFGLALIGGNFVFLSQAPLWLRRLSMVTPNGWALRAFTDLGTGSPASSVVTPVAMMLLITAVVGSVAGLRARRSLVTR